MYNHKWTRHTVSRGLRSYCFMQYENYQYAKRFLLGRGMAAANLPVLRDMQIKVLTSIKELFSMRMASVSSPNTLFILLKRLYFISRLASFFVRYTTSSCRDSTTAGGVE